VDGGNVIPGFFVSPNSDRIVYRADQDEEGVVELYLRSLGDGTIVKLNGPFTRGGNVLNDAFDSIRVVFSRSVGFSPAGSHVVYIADQDTDQSFEIYATRVDGTGNVKLNPPLALGAAVLPGFAMVDMP
ncbi:MAG: hypothetical protein AAGA56_12085, partial [Myxococcota bacterium]